LFADKAFWPSWLKKGAWGKGCLMAAPKQKSLCAKTGFAVYLVY
jgi:hypothetical protein